MAVFDLSGFNKQASCTNGGKPDPETGCVACGTNAQSVYEQCRQTFFLKEQTKIDQARLNQESQPTAQVSNTATQTAQQWSQNMLSDSPTAQGFQFGSTAALGVILVSFSLGYLTKRLLSSRASK